ncbi:MAG: hypothetical protein ACXAE3_13315 [Candidatus Kariarchaeaceae archaeon]|jgi:hypothetical protein
MTTQAIKEVLENGVCPVCQSEVITDEQMKEYMCENDRNHFHLELSFHGGEKISAKLNGKPVDQDDLDQIDW